MELNTVAMRVNIGYYYLNAASTQNILVDNMETGLNF